MAAKLSGSRFMVLKGDGSQGGLHFAVLQQKLVTEQWVRLDGRAFRLAQFAGFFTNVVGETKHTGVHQDHGEHELLKARL